MDHMKCPKCRCQIEYSILATDEYAEAMTNEHYEQNAFSIVLRCPNCSCKLTEEIAS